MKIENSSAGSFRGAGRFEQALTEAGLSIERFPIWDPFSPTSPKKTGRGVIVVFDVIPLKFPQYFPIGIKGRINLFKNKRALKNFNKIITISDHAKDDIVKYLGINPVKIVVIYPPIGKIFLSPHLPLISSYPLTPPIPLSSPSSPPYAIYVGDVNWNKNLPNLARAIKLGNIPCVFVGKPFSPSPSLPNLPPRSPYPLLPTSLSHPWQQSYKEFLSLAKDDKRFIFKGYVPDNELIALYKNATCNVLISHDEGFGYSYIEAASQGTPSVLSDTPIFRETAENTALFANPDSPEEIAQKIKTLVEKNSERTKLGRAAQKRVLEVYSPERFEKEILSF